MSLPSAARLDVWLLQLLPDDPRRPNAGRGGPDEAVTILDSIGPRLGALRLVPWHRGLAFLAGFTHAQGGRLRTLSRAHSARVARTLDARPATSQICADGDGLVGFPGTFGEPFDFDRALRTLGEAEEEVASAIASSEEISLSIARRDGLLTLLLGTPPSPRARLEP